MKPPAETEEQREAYLADRRYNHLDKRMMPYSESLKDTLVRVIPFWTDHISQYLLDGQTVLVSAHGNSIRALLNILKMCQMKISLIMKLKQVHRLFMN